ncbi:MAG: substrate-binding domain-containing protein [Armatimonadetes bacterium]|nr:substrate-binding domain-containing protein [Armatimonadota bacterium]
MTGCQAPENAANTAAGNASNTSAQSSAPNDKKTFLIGMSQANKGEPWRQAMNDQITEAAKKHPQLKVVFADAAQNNTKQVADVENFLQQGIDLLIISPNEAAPLTDVVSKAYDKGVPVILLDRRINGNKYTMWIGANNTQIGERAGKYVANWCKTNRPNGCGVLELRGLEGSTPAKERGDGFRAGLKSNPKAKIIASQNADWLREKAVSVSQAMFQANPNADVVYGHNDPMAEAAIISAQNAGKKAGDLLFVGIDALPTPDGGIRSVLEKRLDATYIYPTGGQQAIDWAVKILEKKAKAPKEVVLQTEEVTPANAAQILKKYSS